MTQTPIKIPEELLQGSLQVGLKPMQGSFAIDNFQLDPLSAKDLFEENFSETVSSKDEDDSPDLDSKDNSSFIEKSERRHYKKFWFKLIICEL